MSSHVPRSGERSSSPSREEASSSGGHRGSVIAGLKPPRAAKLKRFDWLTHPPGDNLTPFQSFLVHDVNWSTSPLGPIRYWPAWLIGMVTLVMSDPTPAVVYVDNDDGVTNAIVYNEAYPGLIGNKHPALQGHDPAIGFAEIWPQFVDILSRGREQFETVVGDAQPLLLFRHGFFEETWFSWKFTPIIGPSGYVVGSHATVVENTREIVLDRRSTTLQDIDQQVTSSTSIKDLWQKLSLAMQPNGADIPFVLMYGADIVTSYISDRDRSPGPPPTSATFEAAVGEGTALVAPKSVDLTAESGLGCLFRDAMVRRQPIRLRTEELPGDLAAIFRSREHGEVCTHAIICPIQSPSSKAAVGFILLAQNPRRPYDDDYRDFIERFTKQTSSTANRLLLSEQLLKRTKEYKESETRFSRFASRTPVGLALFDVEGHLLFGNEFWYNIFQFNPDILANPTPGARPIWLDSIHVEDRDNVWNVWCRVLATKDAGKVQFRVLTPQTNTDGSARGKSITVLCQAFADLDDDGNVQSVMSCLTDVSELKELEEQLRARTHEVEARMEHVLEMKRQQENFIDMTSHEIRNPLSAVLHLAEEVFNTSTEIMAMLQINDMPTVQQETIRDALKGSIEAAETITACVLHQKRIVDDILVLSRLDSELLQVTPVATQPKGLINSALKMFEAEIRTANMTLSFDEDKSLHDLNVDWLMFDPNRVIQVLVNLVGNAIKFTKSQEVRNIKVTMSASTTKPTSGTSQIDFVPVNPGRSAQVEKSYDHVQTGETIYLSLGVADTGQGLLPEEKKLLFQRFSQGSKRTHTKYGGSGLGLWISKQLTELHGGQIGISSKERTGSNFLFFIQTRRCAAPKDQHQNLKMASNINRATQNSPHRALVEHIVELDPSERPLAVRQRSERAALEDPQALQQASELQELHVLVVEDNIVNQRIIAKQLRKNGCSVSVANNGQEALEFLQTTVFWSQNKATERGTSEANQAVRLSVVLMDLEMPVMDGVTAVRRIRKLQEEGALIAHIPVLAVTANARGEQLDEAIKAGMDSSITKPYRIPDILTKIRDLAYRHA